MIDGITTGGGRRPGTVRSRGRGNGRSSASSADSSSLEFQLRVARCPAALALALALIRPALEAAATVPARRSLGGARRRTAVAD